MSPLCRRSRSFVTVVATAAFLVAGASLVRPTDAAGTPPTVPQRPSSGDPDVVVAPEWMRAYEQKLEANAVWARIPEETRVRIEADYASQATRFEELLAAARAFAPRIRAHADAVAAYQARNDAFAADVERFHRTCTEPTDEDERRRCLEAREELIRRQEALERERAALSRSAETLNAEVAAHNARSRAWAQGPVQALNALLAEAVRAAKVPLSDAERAALERERETLREEVRGLQEDLRRLERDRASREGDRADWERRHEEARGRAETRVRDVLTDQAVEQGLGLLARRSKALRAEADATLQERINVAGGDAPDRAERVKALDARWKALNADRAEVDGCVGKVEALKLRVQQSLAGLQAGTAEDRAEALEAAHEGISALLSDPLVQRVLKVSGAYASFAGWAKLAADSAVDVADEVAAIVRIRALNEAADRYLADVERIDARLKAKVARIREIGGLLGTGS